MPLPDSFSELYPGRFIKADMFKGQKVTFTITKLDVEVLEGEKGKEPKVVGAFTGPKKTYDHVIPKTVGHCLKRMFGNDPHAWLNKRVTLYPTTTKFGRETVDCIRVWGSPDIAGDMAITIPQGRKKPLEAVMHKVRPGECGFRGDAEQAQPAPAIAAPMPEPTEDWEEGRPHDFLGDSAALVP